MTTIDATDDLIAAARAIAREVARTHGPRAYYEYAEALMPISPALAAWTALHAEAADGNSPDLAAWADAVEEDLRAMRRHGISDASTPSEIAAAWLATYDQD